MKHKLAVLALFVSVWFGMPSQAAVLSFSANATVTDLEEPSAFGFTFLTPITPLTGLVSWNADVSGTLTDGSLDGVTAAPIGGSIFKFLVNGTIVGMDDLGTVSSSFTDSYSGVFDCAGGCTSLGLNWDFTGSGGNDQYALSNTLTITSASIPEPSVLALLALGLAGLGFARGRKQQ